MKTTLTTRFHIATWTVACILTLIPLFNGRPVEVFVGNIIATLFWMAVYYLFFLYMAPAYLIPGKLFAFFSISAGLLLVLPFIGYSLLLLSKAIFNGDFNNFYKIYSLQMHYSGFKALVMAGLYGSFFRLIVEFIRKS
jgi:hypothetical protein